RTLGSRYCLTVDAERRDRVKRKLLRVTAVVLGVVAVAAAILCFVPSVEVYRDASDCFGNALGSLVTIEHHAHREPCAQRWVLEGMRTPVAHQLGMAAYFLLLGVPGLLVWRLPRLRYVMVWTLYAVGSTFAMIVATFELFGDWGKRTVDLWPAQLFFVLASSLVAALIVILPIGSLVVHLVTRTRAAKPVTLPEARVLPSRRA
ncbi:MAG: hypothetical protein ABI867_41225, partial [Kofleriaceae bacterium]